METISGKITGVSQSEGETDKGPWTRWTFVIDEKNYSTFDKKIGGKFGMGDYVQMLGEQKGQYWNMKTMKTVEPESGPVEAETVQVGQAVGKSTVFEKPKDKVEYEIGLRRCRSNALDITERIYKNSTISPTDKIACVLRDAKEFEKYIVTGE